MSDCHCHQLTTWTQQSFSTNHTINNNGSDLVLKVWFTETENFKHLTQSSSSHISPPTFQKPFIDVLQNPQEADEKILRGLGTERTLLCLTPNTSHHKQTHWHMFDGHVNLYYRWSLQSVLGQPGVSTSYRHVQVVPFLVWIARGKMDSLHCKIINGTCNEI